MVSFIRLNRFRWRRWSLGLASVLVAAAAVITGCETDSFMDPSVVGRWERTPVVLPILDRLDVIEDAETEIPGLSKVQPEDLIADTREYVIGSGDLLTVTVFELIAPNVEAVQTRRVDELGMIRLPVLGAVKCEGMTASELEKSIGATLEQRGVLKNPTVTVIVQEGRQNTFSMLADPQSGGTAVGTYNILHPDFRLLDAVALAHGVSGQAKRLLIIRQARLHANPAPEVAIDQPHSGSAPAPVVTRNPAELIDELVKADTTPGSAAATKPAAQPPAAPSGLDVDLQTRDTAQWINVDGKWVRASSKNANAATSPSGSGANASDNKNNNEAALGNLITQRIIDVPFNKLIEGDMRYNIIIRPGDIIRVPAQAVGNVFVMGAINRPGSFLVPGNRDLTLKNLIASAGGLSSIAIPERVDLVRRTSDSQESTVRVNLREIFNGTQPDFYLKPNDLVNIGTSWTATPLAIFRNGLRASYGFGFILDRNFDQKVFGAESPR